MFIVTTALRAELGLFIVRDRLLAQFAEPHLNKVIRIPKHVPDSETERTEEALSLIGRILPEDLKKLTTWEVTLVEELREGKAATRIRLKDLREAVARLYPQDAESIL